MPTCEIDTDIDIDIGKYIHICIEKYIKICNDTNIDIDINIDIDMNSVHGFLAVLAFFSGFSTF